MVRGHRLQTHPELYKVGKGEQGVLICDPYKSAIGRHWRFKNAPLARESDRVVFKLFLDYLKREDFVGADMARKYLQIGFTRARRYANYRGAGNTTRKTIMRFVSAVRARNKKRRLRKYFS